MYAIRSYYGSLHCQVGILGLRGPSLLLIREVADYCDNHRAKFDIGSEDLLEKYLRTIRDAEQEPGPEC